MSKVSRSQGRALLVSPAQTFWGTSGHTRAERRRWPDSWASDVDALLLNSAWAVTGQPLIKIVDSAWFILAFVLFLTPVAVAAGLRH